MKYLFCCSLSDLDVLVSEGYVVLKLQVRDILEQDYVLNEEEFWDGIKERMGLPQGGVMVKDNMSGYLIICVL